MDVMSLWDHEEAGIRFYACFQRWCTVSAGTASKPGWELAAIMCMQGNNLEVEIGYKHILSSVTKNFLVLTELLLIIHILYMHTLAHNHTILRHITHQFFFHFCDLGGQGQRQQESAWLEDHDSQWAASSWCQQRPCGSGHSPEWTAPTWCF